MEHILYYNHRQKGYDFYEESGRFPKERLMDLQKICNDVSEPSSEGIALRYGPLGNDYLLSVIFRQPSGVGPNVRGVNTIVNFLMSPKEADEFFGNITQEGLHDAIYRAEELLKPTDACLQVRELPVSACSNVIPDVQLVTAASYAGGPTLSKQAYFGLKAPVLQEVVAMLKLLPPKVRKQTSFHTDIRCVQESIGIAVNFCDPATLEKARSNGMAGGMSSTSKCIYMYDRNGDHSSQQADKNGFNKYKKLLEIAKNLPCPELSYPRLWESAESWQDLERLLELDFHGNPADMLLRMLPSDMLLQEVRSNRLSEKTLVQLGRSKNITDAVLDAIIKSDVISAEGLLALAKSDRLSEENVLWIVKNNALPAEAVLELVKSGKLQEEAIVQLLNSGSLSGIDLLALNTVAKRKGMKRVMRVISKESQRKEPAVENTASLQDNDCQIQQQLPQEQELQKVDLHPIMCVLKGILKLVVLGALIWGGIKVGKSLMTLSAIPDDQGQTYIVISMDTAKMLWKVLGMSALVAAISAFITHHITKWNTLKKQKNTAKQAK